MTVNVPGAIRRIVADREFEACDEDGASYGSIRVNDEGNSWGYGRFLRQRGADQGDILIIQFDLTMNAAMLRLADDETLEEMSPET